MIKKLAQKKINVSVIIPFYNNKKTIGKTLQSVFNQTYRPAEIIIIDDGSNLKNKIILRSLKAKYKNKIKIHSFSNNKGPAAARNLGWETAKSKYIAFLDADDKWHPQKLEICGRVLERLEAPGLFHRTWAAPNANAALKYDEEPRRLEDYSCQKMSRYRWLIKNYAATPSIIVRRNISERFDPTFRFCEDHELWLRIAFCYEPFLRLEGPPLTRLGRPTMSTGGLSGRVHEMRLGEIRMYSKFCRQQPARMVLLPFLAGWSLAKHVFSRRLDPLKPNGNRLLGAASANRSPWSIRGNTQKTDTKGAESIPEGKNI